MNFKILLQLELDHHQPFIFLIRFDLAVNVDHDFVQFPEEKSADIS